MTRTVAECYASHLLKSRGSPNTYNKHLNLLSLVFRVLKAKARINSIVWDDIQRKTLTTQSRRELTLEELRTICDAGTGELRTLFVIGIYTGMRLGDCVTLRKGEVDLSRSMIRRVPNKTARRNPKPVCVPIHPVLRGLLEESLLTDRTEFVLPKLAELYLERSDGVTDLVQAHFKACAIRTHKPGTGKDHKRAIVEVGFHSLRHSFVSLCRESNAPLAVVESLVGHSNPAMTRYYTHVGEIAAGKAVAALPSIMGDESTGAEPSNDSLLIRARTVAENINADNWENARSQLLALLSA